MNAFRGVSTLSLALATLAGTMTLSPQPANAQGLFDALFGRPRVIRRLESYPEPPPPPSKKRYGTVKSANGGKSAKKAAPAVIKSPGYNDYRADPLVAVNFSQLIKVEPQKVAATDVPPASPFAALADYRLLVEKPIANAIVEHYAASAAPLWHEGGKLNARAEAALAEMKRAGSYGLNADDYAVDRPPAGADTAALQRFEMQMSARLLRYVRDAKGGRIDPNRISGYYDFAPKPLSLTAVLAALSAASDVGEYLRGQHPQNAEYEALRRALAVVEAPQDTRRISVDPALSLRVGESSPEFPKLLAVIARDLNDETGAQFGELLYRLKDSQKYESVLEPVIRTSQARAGVQADGIIGPRTVEAIAGGVPQNRREKVLVALEQMRWMPSELGATRVFINQPAYTAAYIENGEEKLSMRTVIGKTANQTSFFYDEIEQVDYNPYWGVPQSILVNEMLPRLRRDPGYLDRAGYEVYNSKGKKVPSSSVAWGSYGAKIPYSVRQTPSEANALGELKILFPNKHAIYMHDTPQKKLFERDARAFSHGCVRLADPRGMAAAVLGKSRDYVAGKLAKGHSMEKVSRKIPVYVAYFTAWPNGSGTVEYFADVYGRDARLMDAIEQTDKARAPTT